MSIHHQLCALLCCVVAAGTTLAQNPSAPVQKPKHVEPSHSADREPISLFELIGADVVVRAQPTAKSDGSPESAHAGKSIGKVKDLVLTTQDGALAWAVLSVEGNKTILVPIASLKCSTIEKKACVELRDGESSLRTMPSFDVDGAKREGLDRAVESAQSGNAGTQKSPTPDGKTPKDDPSDKPDKNDSAAPKSSASSAPRLVLASELKGCKLNARDKEFGQVRDAAVDTKSNRVAYVIVSHGAMPDAGGPACLIPFAACAWATAGDKPVLTSTKTFDQLGQAPDYQKADGKIATPDQMKKADEFFGRQGTGSGV